MRSRDDDMDGDTGVQAGCLLLRDPNRAGVRTIPKPWTRHVVRQAPRTRRYSIGIGPCACLAAATTILAGCSGQVDTDASSVASPAPSTETMPANTAPPSPTPATPPSTPGDAKTYTITSETDQGYRQTATVVVHPAIRGSKTEAVQSAWSAVRGTGQVPCQNVDVSNDLWNGTFIVTETAAYAVGTLRIVNETKGFSPAAQNWQFSTGYLGKIPENSAMGVGYSNSADCDGMSSGGQMIQPKWQGDTWGPVPIVFAYNNVFTPKAPQGNEKVLSDFPVTVNLGVTVMDAAGKQLKGIPVVLAKT